MIDHDYQIITREETITISRAKRFIAKLSHVYITKDGKRIKVSYPPTEFSGDTQGAAIVRANDALRRWLKNNKDLS